MNMRRRSTKTVLPLDVLEGRVVLSAATHPLHALAATHHASVEVARLHTTAAAANPVLVNLTPTTTGITITSVTYDRRVHLISVEGTVTVNSANSSSGGYYPYVPTYPNTQYIGVSASQAVTKFQSVSGSQYSSITVANANVVTVPFEEQVLASSGNFGAGIVNLTVNDSNVYGGYTTLNVLARMRAAKAY